MGLYEKFDGETASDTDYSRATGLPVYGNLLYSLQISAPVIEAGRSPRAIFFLSRVLDSGPR